jgi:hypothetical protein
MTAKAASACYRFDEQRSFGGAAVLREPRTGRYQCRGADDRRHFAPGSHHRIPDEAYRTPETWARRAYPNLIYFHEVDKGGHFAAWQEPQLFAEEMRAAFRHLR